MAASVTLPLMALRGYLILMGFGGRRSRGEEIGGRDDVYRKLL